MTTQQRRQHSHISFCVAHVLQPAGRVIPAIARIGHGGIQYMQPELQSYNSESWYQARMNTLGIRQHAVVPTTFLHLIIKLSRI